MLFRSPFEFSQAVLGIREELAWIKKYKGGRLRNLKFKMQNPKEFLHSRSPSRSRNSLSLPSTPQRQSADIDMAAINASSPSEKKKRGRSRSNSTLAGAALAGMVAGSIGAWSPIERTGPDFNSLPYGKPLSKEVTESIEMHPETKATDPVVVVSPSSPAEGEQHLPPSQHKEMTPGFGIGPYAEEPQGKPDDGKKKDDVEP